MLIKKYIDNQDGFDWYDVYSDTEGKAVLQKETGIIYACVCMREDDSHTYEECDDPNYIGENNEQEIGDTDTSI